MPSRKKKQDKDEAVVIPLDLEEESGELETPT